MDTIRRNECSICLSEVTEATPVLTRCHHFFCEPCLDEWLQQQKHTLRASRNYCRCPDCRKITQQPGTCPLCRRPVTQYWRMTLPQPSTTARKPLPPNQPAGRLPSCKLAAARTRLESISDAAHI